MVPVHLRGSVHDCRGVVPDSSPTLRVASGVVVQASSRGSEPRRDACAGVFLRYDSHRAGAQPLHQGHGLDRPAVAKKRASGIGVALFYIRQASVVA